jgi:hypothetical protein
MTEIPESSISRYSRDQFKVWINLKSSPGEKFLLGIFVILSVLFLYITFLNWAYDDPFITFRYAKNLVAGYGFVYNPGERILSTTTPLFTLLLSAIHLVTTDIHFLAILIGVVSLIIGGLLLFDLSRSWNSLLVGWTGLLLYTTFPLLARTLGSETPLYLALCIAVYAFYARKRYELTAVFAGLATLARPDGILVPLILGADYLMHRRGSIPWRPVVIFSGIVAAWVLFAWFYFGSPLPVTLLAKQRQGAMLISQGFIENFPSILSEYLRWPYVLQSILAIFGLIYALWKKRAWVVFLAWPILYFLAYSFLGVSGYFWYYAPLVPGFIVATGLGISGIRDLFHSIAKERSFWIGQTVNVMTGLLLLILLISNVRNLYQASRQVDNRYAIYKASGEWLRENTNPEDKVGSLEVGIIGYYSERTMVDFAGLIQPKVAERLDPDSTYEDAATWAIETYRPDYIVLQEGLFSDLERNYTSRSCVPIKKFTGEQFQYPWNLEIYDCSN